VAPLTKDVIRSLAGFKSQGSPVVSLYLDVDGRRHIRPKDYEVHLDELLRQAANGERGRSRSTGRAGRAATGSKRGGTKKLMRTAGKGGASGIATDLQLIEAHVRQGVDRSRTRGLAIFSCAEAGLWETFELAAPVRNELVVNEAPHVRQLERVLEEYERFGVLLADRQRTRMFVFDLGELVDKSELLEELPRHEDEGGDWDRDHVHDHQAAAARHHLRRAAQVAFNVYQAQGFERLILGAPDSVAKELERELHPYLRERIAARLSVPVNARDDEIRQAALEVQEQLERALEAATVQRLRESQGTGRGVVGLAPVLVAIIERRVDTLVVSDGYTAPGWRCHSCGYLGTKGRACPVCATTMIRVDEVVEEAVEEALQQSCTVKICVGNADLDVLGRIGAILRF
jgi:peptide chain release factor subunit 1